MRYKRIRSIIMAGVLGMLNVLFAYSQPADSLGYYLELAARNNPQINADFSLYKASLEKVPQAGAYPDPELEIGFFLKPMEILSGKQIADFTLMQMFPWFGTRKAARNEATEMARMAYEQFRNSRNNLYYEVKSQWYQLCNISEQYKNTQANLRLLDQLEQLALNRFSAPSAKAGGSSVYPPPYLLLHRLLPPYPVEVCRVWEAVAWEALRYKAREHPVVRCPECPAIALWVEALWEVATPWAECRTYCESRWRR